MYSTNQLTLEQIHVTFVGKAKWFWIKIIYKQSKLRVNLILDELIALYLHPKNSIAIYKITEIVRVIWLVKTYGLLYQ